MSPSKAKETKASKAQKAIELSQTTANFALLPFVVQLLSNKVPGKGVQPLPIGRPENLTLEAVEAVQDIANQAVLSYLARDIGWAKRPYVAYGAERPLEGRLWQHSTWSNHGLSFSDTSMDALLIAYNLTRKVPKAAELRSGNLFSTPSQAGTSDSSLSVAKKQGQTVKDIQDAIDEATKESHQALKGLEFKRNGDLLLHHRVYAQLLRIQGLDANTHKAFLRNPLNLLYNFPACRDFKDKHIESLTRLLESDVEPLLSWLGVAWVKRWIALEPRRWNPSNAKTKPLDNFRRFCDNQAMLFAGWYALMEQKERPDLLVPLVDYYKKLIETCGPTSQWVSKFRAMTSDLRHVERGEYTDLYVKAMTPALTLRVVYEDARELHPVEREAPHHLYMDHYQRAGFEQTLEKIEDFLETLQPKIG